MYAGALADAALLFVCCLPCAVCSHTTRACPCPCAAPRLFVYPSRPPLTQAQALCNGFTFLAYVHARCCSRAPTPVSSACMHPSQPTAASAYRMHAYAHYYTYRIQYINSHFVLQFHMAILCHLATRAWTSNTPELLLSAITKHSLCVARFACSQ